MMIQSRLFKAICTVWFVSIQAENTFSSATIRSSIDRNHRSTQNKGTIQYEHLTLTEIYDQMADLESTYPEFVTVKSTQEEFGLASPCQRFEQQNDGCITRYMIIEDPVIYSNTDATTALKQRPDVFLSGALHGDERVGPVVMMEVAKLLVSAAACESGGRFKPTVECATMNSKYTRQQISWLARLVSTRRIIIVPAANSKGYYYRERNELYRTQFDINNQWIDPNRDFSFDNSPNTCMRTIAARSVNEIFRKYLIQMSMTYHSGLENISFEWGAKSVPSGKVSPDDTAQRIIAEKMSDFAGELYSAASKDQFYEHGDMNSIVYAINGGFEDWVYAGSWLTDYAVQCTPSTYGGYDVSKTTYDDVTLNTFNILVEISSNKNPKSNELGTDKNLLNAPFEYDDNVHNGYAAKHIRTALMSIDTVEPYVQIKSAKKKVFKKQFKPLRQLTDKWCQSKFAVKQRRGRKARIEWSVGGSYNVDETFLLYGLWSDFPEQFNCINQVSHDDITSILNDSSGKFKSTSAQSGNTKWSDPMSGTDPTFKARANISNQFSVGDKVAVFAVAKVDQDWVNEPTAAMWPEGIDVQSHMVKMRTDPNYLKRKGTEREVEGRLYWISVPVTILVR